MASITLRQLALEAGVSTAAVSYALNGLPGVSEKTRKHILKVAEKIGYQPDAEMTKLMAHVATRRGRDDNATLAFITDHGTLRAWEWNSSVLAPWTGAGARAKELGYHLEEFWYTEPGMTPSRLRSILRARGIQGLLFSMASSDYRRLDFDFTGFACAMSGICFQEPEINVVMPDHFRNTLEALTHAYTKGYRRPLLAQPAGASERTNHTIEGAYLYFCSVHNEVQALPVFRSRDYEKGPFVAFVDQHRPDLVVSTHGSWGRQMGSRVPEEFGWMTLGWMKGEDDDLAGVDRRLYEQGGFVVDMVVAAIHRNEPGVPSLRKEVMVRGQVVDGMSLPVRSDSARIFSSQGPKRARAK